MDLTVPAPFCDLLGIRAGDLFSVEVVKQGGRVVLTYTRVFPSSSSASSERP